jgi:proline iminopeptidase
MVVAVSTFLAAENVAGAEDRRETVEDRIVNIEATLYDVPDVSPHDRGLPGKYVDIGRGVKLYVIEEGDGIPIVLLNGGPGNSLQSFVPHFSRASEFARVIYYDPRGVGRSDWEPGEDGYSTPQAMEDLEMLRKRLGIEKWVVLGWSWGGLLAQRYVLMHPNRVLGLILLSSSTSMELELSTDETPDNLASKERNRIREIYSIHGNPIIPVHSDDVDLFTLRKMVFNAFLNGAWKRQYYYKPSRERIAHIARYEWIHDKNYNQQMRDTGFDRNLSGCFKNFPISTLIIYGVWDMSFSRELPTRLQREIAGSKLLILGKSSHSSFASEPERFFSEIQRFVEGLSDISDEKIAAFKQDLHTLCR